MRGGYVHGATDEFGFAAAENKVHVHDLHATVLWLLGFDHEKLTFRNAGRDFRLTDVHGHVVKELIAGGKVRPVIDRRFLLDEIVDALRWVDDGHARGKVIVTP